MLLTQHIIKDTIQMTESKDDVLERLRNLVARLEAAKPVKQVNYKRMPDGIIEIEDYEKHLDMNQNERDKKLIDLENEPFNDFAQEAFFLSCRTTQGNRRCNLQTHD